MSIVIDPSLQAYIDPLTQDEHDALERSLLAEGCRDALVLWGEVLVDGHNRYGICQKHQLPFQTVQNTRFQSIEDVHLWMIDQHLGRRSVSDFQRGVLALRKNRIVGEQQARTHAATQAAAQDAAPTPDDPATSTALRPALVARNSREAIAKEARLSSNQVVMIEKIEQQAAPELVAALKSGVISLNAAAAVASLPLGEQVEAATAGKGELKQAAKRAREAGRKPRAATPEATSEATSELPTEGAPTDADSDPRLQALQQRVAELTAQNQALRQQVQALQAQLV